jgi:hypothetical protein
MAIAEAAVRRSFRLQSNKSENHLQGLVLIDSIDTGS